MILAQVHQVLIVTGSSARMTSMTKETPVDAAVVGIVDSVDLNHPNRKKRS